MRGLPRGEICTAGGPPPGLVGNTQGLEVYCGAWRGRLFEALRTNYPVLHRVLGDADLARMEWRICLAFDAVPLGFERLARTTPEDWPKLCFRLQPGFALIDLEWSVAPVWRELSETDDPSHPVAPPERLDNIILIWRKALSPMWRSVVPQEAGLLRAIEAGESFGQLCARAGTEVGEDDAAITVVRYLQQWVADELLAGE